MLYCNKRDGGNVGYFIQNLVILNGKFGPYVLSGGPLIFTFSFF